uniref:Uncharacterized protein n=1 Tax=Cannabis sativa TaxID=3483 RepID=A0A803Q6X1_CANSA
MARPSTRSQDGVPPSTNDNIDSDAPLDVTSAPLAQSIPTNRQATIARSRSQLHDDIENQSPRIEPQLPAQDQRTSNNRHINDDVSSPFFLSSGDHPVLVLVSTFLNGTNY